MSIELYYSKGGEEWLENVSNSNHKEFLVQETLDICSRLKIKRNNLIDLGCGYGRIAIELAEHFKSIRGLDISPDLIKKAKTIARQRGISNVDYQVSDIKDYSTNYTSDLAICYWSTIDFFSDLELKSFIINNLKYSNTMILETRFYEKSEKKKSSRNKIDINMFHRSAEHMIDLINSSTKDISVNLDVKTASISEYSERLIAVIYK